MGPYPHLQILYTYRQFSAEHLKAENEASSHIAKKLCLGQFLACCSQKPMGLLCHQNFHSGVAACFIAFAKCDLTFCAARLQPYCSYGSTAWTMGKCGWNKEGGVFLDWKGVSIRSTQRSLFLASIHFPRSTWTFTNKIIVQVHVDPTWKRRLIPREGNKCFLN